MSEAVTAPSAPSPQNVPPPQAPTKADGKLDANGSSPISSDKQTEPKAAPRIYDVKVNGRIVKMSEQELIENAGMSHAASEKFQSASQKRAEIDKILSDTSMNPIEKLMDPALGLSKDQVIEKFEKWYLENVIEPQTLTADQRMAKERDAKLAKYEAEAKERETKATQEKEEKQNSVVRQQLQENIVDMLKKSGLPPTAYLASRMAHYMRQNLMNGYEAPPEMIVRMVKQEQMQQIQGNLKDATDEQMIELLTPDLVQRLIKYELKKLRDGRADKTPSLSKTSVDSSSSQKIDYNEVNERLRRMRMGK